MHGTVTPPGEPRRKLTPFAALEVRDYRLFFMGLILYVLGMRAEYVAFAWIIWELTLDPIYLGYLGLAQGLPFMLLQLGGGVLADRVNRLRLLIGTQLITAIVLTIAFFLTVTGLARVEHLLLLSMLSSIFRSFDEPSRLSLLPQLIDRSRLSNAITLGSMPWQAGRVLGPSIAGILIASFGGAVGFAMSALVSYAALALYSCIKVDARPPRPSGKQSVFRQLLEGLSYVRHNHLFASLIFLAIFNSLFGTSYITLLPVYADWYFQVGSTGYGLMQTAHGIGAICGTLTIAILAERLRRRGIALLIAGTCFGTLLAIFSQSPALLFALPVLALMGIGNTVYLTVANTLLQENVPDRLRGRVMSIFALCYNLIPLGGTISSWMASAVDARFALLVGGSLVASTAFLMLVFSRRLRAIA